jgi:hypothetical protein
MRDHSVFRVAYFVQMGVTFQIKFTLSVAGALHPSRSYPKLEQGFLMMWVGQRPILTICLTVDHSDQCGLD